MERENNWPPAGLDPNLPADHQGMNDPGNDLPDEDELEEDPDYDVDDIDADDEILKDNLGFDE